MLQLLVLLEMQVVKNANPKQGFGIKSAILSLFLAQHGNMFMAKTGYEDLDFLRELIEIGRITPIIDKTYPDSEIPEAFRYLEKEHTRGKVVIRIMGSPSYTCCHFRLRIFE